MLYDSIIDLVGRTPILRLSVICPKPEVHLMGKMEMANPGGSVKDRAALGMILRAEELGLLEPDVPMVEPSSGNTGISLAMIAARRGYRMVVTMPASMTPERKAIMEHFGAKVILTPAESGMSGAIEEAERMVRDEGYLMLSQFTNEANPDFHSRTTAPEILKDLGSSLDYFVSGVGTGGTITGAGRVLKCAIPNLQIVAVEPADSPVLSGGTPAPHDIPGLGPGFVSDVMDTSLLNEIVQIQSREAHEMSRRLGREEGLLAGISAGAAVAAALHVIAKALAKPSRDYTRDPLRVLAVLPDTGERYMSVVGKDGW